MSATSYDLRPAAESEWPALAEQICAIDPWKRLGSTPDKMLTYWREEPQWRILVAASGPTLLGAVVYCLTCGPERVRALGVSHFLDRVFPQGSGAEPQGGYIRILAVFPSHQGKGVGGRLLAAAEDAVAEACGRMFLCVSEVNGDARRLYERQGYSFVGAIENCIIPGNTENLMTKPLARRA